jgi:phenylpyruvate tautomerase PptA (4-oxalocrotonate tautomerase family)
MPLYMVATQAGSLCNEAKAKLAGELTILQAENADVPKSWVHVIFQDYAPENGFTAGEPDAKASLLVTICTGRSGDYKRGLLTRLRAHEAPAGSSRTLMTTASNARPGFPRFCSTTSTAGHFRRTRCARTLRSFSPRFCVNA